LSDKQSGIKKINMKTTINRPLALLCIALACGGGRATFAQTFLAGKITVKGDIPAIDNKAFACTQVRVKGEEFASMTSEDQAWSIDKMPLLIGTTDVGYPMMAMLKCSDGNFCDVFPVILKAKIEIKAGELIHSDGYAIDVKRSVKAGDSIPAIRVGKTFVLSVEAAEGAKTSGEAEPWFTALKEDTKANDRSTAIEAWRIETAHVGLTQARPSTSSEADIAAYNKSMDYYNSAIAKNRHGENRDLDGAIADCTKAIELKPDFEGAYCLRGIAKKDKGDFDSSIEDYNKAIELKPAFDRLSADYNGRCNAKRGKGDFDGAIADCTKAIELVPDDDTEFSNVAGLAKITKGGFYNDRGLAKNGKGDLDGAIADYTKAIELIPEFSTIYGIDKTEGEFYNNRGLARKAKGDLDGGNADHTKANQLSRGAFP